MRVTPIAWTCVDWHAVQSEFGGTKFAAEAIDEFEISDPDHLGELAGRACYKAFDRKRAETATTQGYLNNILEQGHYSVLEHSTVTFSVKHVSRALLLELERHRFLSFSVESQRYVNQATSHPKPVIPPAIAVEQHDIGPKWLRKSGVQIALEAHYQASMAAYSKAVTLLLAQGRSVKEAREAARAFLPNCTPVDLIITGNLRCWRDVLGKRYHASADKEIRQFAALVLKHLRELAPLSVQDFPDEPFEA